jgi:hypothetical protein
MISLIITLVVVIIIYLLVRYRFNLVPGEGFR